MLFGNRWKCSKRIALLGGSFDPPHKGHGAICELIVNDNHADEVWIVPCFVHPFEKPLSSFEDRLAMCRLAFCKLSIPLRVLDVEKRLGGISHTVRTIKRLQDEFPKDTFLLVRGRDVTEESDKWKDIDDIRRMVKIMDIPRGGRSPIPDISSTEVRRRVKGGESFTDLVEKEIAVYITTKELYR